MKYLIFGKGYVANKFLQFLGEESIISDLRLEDYSAIQNELEKEKPDVVINCAGKTGRPNVDWCEDNKGETLKVNVGGAINAMQAALEVGAYPIQIASGCIYSGGPEKQFTEEDPPNFFNSFYSRMKVVMQEALKELPVLQLRIRMPLSRFSHPRNLINKITAYQKVISVPNSVTLVEDLWPALEKLAELRLTGILNLTNEGYLEHAQILQAYKKIVNPKHYYQPISLEELQGKGGITKAERSNCVLSIVKAKSLGLSLPVIDDLRLAEIMRDFKDSISA